MNRRRWQVLVLCLMFLSMAGLVGAIGFTQVKVTVAAPPVARTESPAPPKEPACGSPHDSHNYTEDTEKETEHAFGPSADYPGVPLGDMAPLVVAELKLRLCGNANVGGDWRLMTALMSKVDPVDMNLLVRDHDEWLSLVRDFYERIDWGTAVVQHLQFKPGVQVDTMYMTTSATDALPTVHPWTMQGKDSNFLLVRAHQRDGTPVTLVLRLPCGFQPTTISVG